MITHPNTKANKTKEKPISRPFLISDNEALSLFNKKKSLSRKISCFKNISHLFTGGCIFFEPIIRHGLWGYFRVFLSVTKHQKSKE